MKIPIMLRIAVLVLATTGFYAYVGQMVPQKEVQPPVEIVLKTDLSQAEMAKVGREIMDGKGLCLTCHTIGKTTGPYRFPDLANVAVRAKTRKPGYTDVDYFAESLYEPNAFIVSVAHNFGICRPVSAAARISDVPSGTVTDVPSISSVTIFGVSTAGVPRSV